MDNNIVSRTVQYSTLSIGIYDTVIRYDGEFLPPDFTCTHWVVGWVTSLFPFISLSRAMRGNTSEFFYIYYFA